MKCVKVVEVVLYRDIFPFKIDGTPRSSTSTDETDAAPSDDAGTLSSLQSQVVSLSQSIGNMAQQGAVQEIHQNVQNMQDVVKSLNQTVEMLKKQQDEKREETSVPDEIAYDPYKLLLYNKAIRKGKETEKVLRINIIGNYKQGKTSLARSLIGQSSEGVTSTNGIDISRYTFKRSKDGSFSANKCENDSQAITNRVAAVARSIHLNAMQNIDKMSVENRSDENRSERKDIEIKPLNANTEQPTYNRKEDTVPKRIHEIQPNKEDNVVQSSSERKPKNKLLFSAQEYETFSDAMEKEDESEQLLDIWDFGGQYIFYVTHTLFHCKNALYLLVFDLTSPLDEIVRDENFPNETGEKDMAFFAKFWVESIDAYTGPGTQVILIGTHKDELANPDQLKDDYFKKVRRLFDGTDDNQLSNHIQPEDFAVDNSNSSESGIRELFAFILKKHQELVQTVEIPARWIQLEKALNDERGKKVVTFQDVMNIDKTIKFPLHDEDQVKLFLLYHHDKGRLFYFDDGQPSDPIVLDPTFLIDAFKCIITSETFALKYHAHAEWIRLKQEGILTEKLIDKVWSQQENFKQHKDVLLKFLSKQNILSQVMGCQSGTGTVKQESLFVVPSMLRNVKHATDKLKLFLDKRKQTQIRYVLKLTRPSVVQIVFHRITAAMLGTWPVVKCDNTKLHFENICVFKVLETTEYKSTNHAAVIECIPKCGSIELRLVHLDHGEVRIGVADQLRRYVESLVMVEFRKLTCSYRDSAKPYSRAYRCNHEDHPAGSGSITIEELNENENENLRCPDERTHEIDFFRNAKEVWFIRNRDKEDYPDLQLTGEHLSFLSQAFGKNWQLLGPALGIEETEMNRIDEDHRSACLKIYQMLLKWKKNVTAEKATLDALVDVVKNYSTVTVGWDYFRNLRDEFNRKSNKAGFIQPLSDKIVSLNENLILQCEIRRSLQVIWQKNGEVIKPDDHIKISADNVQVLTVEKVCHDDTGTYRCVCGESITECVVTVQDPTSSLEIIEGLSDTDVSYIRSKEEIIKFASFTCVLNRNSTDVTWFKREKCIEQSDKYDIEAEGTIHKLKIKNVTEEDEDVYSVKAEGQKSEARLYIDDTEEELRLFQEHLENTQGERLGVTDSVLPIILNSCRSYRLKKFSVMLGSESVVGALFMQMQSVGVLVSHGNAVGTVFRVGTNSVMTAYHVVRSVVDPGNKGEADLSLLTGNNTFINFNESAVVQPVMLYRIKENFIFNIDLDVAVLEISNPSNLPMKMTLRKPKLFETVVTNVSLIGYGHTNHTKKCLDPECEILSPNSQRIQSALAWLQQNLGYYKTVMQQTLQDENLVDSGYLNYDHPAKIIFNCSMEHGGSGAPAVTKDNEGSFTVVAMLTHGLPEVYFKLPPELKTKFPKEYCLKMGTRMTSIYEWIKATQHESLVQDFFN